MRIIAHLDMDAFFAAVEERTTPRFFGLPIVIGADPQKGYGRGVVSTANYKAREFGIHSAMPIKQAWELAEVAKMQGKPETIFLPPNMNLYAETSDAIMQIVRRHISLVEQTSIDETFLDLSFAKDYATAKTICQKIKEEIKQQEKLTCSIGIGPNKLIAKIASDIKKPDGLTIVGSDDPKLCPELVEGFLNPLPIRKIPGIGPKTEEIFKKLGVKVIADLKKFSEAELSQMLGKPPHLIRIGPEAQNANNSSEYHNENKNNVEPLSPYSKIRIRCGGKWGLEIYAKARGIDDSPVCQNREIKSIGEQETFPQDTLNPNYIFDRLGQMAQNIIKRLAKEEFKNFRTLVVIIRFSDFETKTKSKTLEKPTSHLSVLQFESMKLLTPFLDNRQNPRQKLIRLIGLRVEKLST